MGATMMLATAGSAAAGPFGIDMGASLERFSVQQDAEGIAVIDAPDAHEDFTFYMVVHHKNFGVCAVQARTDTIKSNVFGDQIKERFYEMREDLREIYGEPEDFDFMAPAKTKRTFVEVIDGDDKEPEEWMRSILKKKRVFSSVWNKNRKPDMKDNISNIIIEPFVNPSTGKRSEGSGYLVIRYEFNNFEECRYSIESEISQDRSPEKF